MCRVFFFNDTATTEIYTLSLHDALPISLISSARAVAQGLRFRDLDVTVKDTLAWHEQRPADQKAKLRAGLSPEREADRKSTRLNSSHANISYAVFCLKKKKK